MQRQYPPIHSVGQPGRWLQNLPQSLFALHWSPFAAKACCIKPESKIIIIINWYVPNVWICTLPEKKVGKYQRQPEIRTWREPIDELKLWPFCLEDFCCKEDAYEYDKNFYLRLGYKCYEIHHIYKENCRLKPLMLTYFLIFIFLIKYYIKIK